MNRATRGTRHRPVAIRGKGRASSSSSSPRMARAATESDSSEPEKSNSVSSTKDMKDEEHKGIVSVIPELVLTIVRQRNANRTLRPVLLNTGRDHKRLQGIALMTCHILQVATGHRLPFFIW